MQGRWGAPARTLRMASAVGMPQSAKAAATCAWRRSGGRGGIRPGSRRVPPAPATSMAATPALARSRASCGEKPQPTSLGDDRHGQGAADSLDFTGEAGEVAIAFGLDGFLEGVEMQDEGVGRDHFDRAQAVGGPVAVVELDGADVGEEEDIGGDGADAQTVGEGRILEGGALGTEAHGDTMRLGGFGESEVQAAGEGRTAGHGGDEQGGRRAICRGSGRWCRHRPGSGPAGRGAGSEGARGPVVRAGNWTSWSRLMRMWSALRPAMSGEAGGVGHGGEFRRRTGKRDATWREYDCQHWQAAREGVYWASVAQTQGRGARWTGRERWLRLMSG